MYVFSFSFWNVEMFEAKLDEFMAYTSKCVSQIEPRYVHSPSFGFCILNDFLKHFNVLHTSVDALEEGFLVACVDIPVAHHEFVQPGCFDLMIRLT